MRVQGEIEVETLYMGAQRIKKAEIFAEIDQKGGTVWKIEGQNGLCRYVIGFYESMKAAYEVYKHIQYQLLKAMEQSIKGA